MLNQYLAASEFIDWKQTEVFAKAKALSAGLTSEEDIAKACFEFVRDQIKHSLDYNLNPVTCKASDALKHSTGYCYAKSHLLAALLRANGIPTALCYQRLTTGDHADNPYCLHGLNAIFLKSHGWYRVDARGNKLGVEADFCPPQENLAFPVVEDGEADLSQLWAEPRQEIIDCLTSYEDIHQVAKYLPDMQN